MTLIQKFGCGFGVAVAMLGGAINAPGVPEIPKEYKIGGFAVGCQAWTFNRFTLFEAIEKTAQAGGRVIELFPGQKLSKDAPDVNFSHNATDELIQKVKDKLAQHKVRAVNYGVFGAKGEAEWRKVFDFAKKMGFYGLTTESVEEMDTIEKLVKEYDICVAIHWHPKQPDNPNYRLWDPNHILSLLRGRDARIGACADTGHWATSGIKPMDGLKLLRGRIVSLHLKERAEIGRQTDDAIFGTGICNIGGILDELKRQGFAGNIALEYEYNWDNSVPDVAQCIGFVRGYTTRKQ